MKHAHAHLMMCIKCTIGQERSRILRKQQAKKPVPLLAQADSGKTRADFAERFRSAMIGHKASELARALGISHSALSRWLDGTFEPSVSKLAVLGSILNVNIDWLISGRGSMRPDELPGYVKPISSVQPEPLAFERAWLASNILHHPVSLDTDLRAATLLHQVEDDAMEPTARRGDVLLALRGAANANGPYLIGRTHLEPGETVAGDFILDATGKLANRLSVRRVEWTAKPSAILKCDNPAYPLTVELERERKDLDPVILGRIIWQGRLI
jgi:transcriptional regulator with XRE-family HTH domain